MTAGLVLASRSFGHSRQAEGGLSYKFVNRTGGKFTDEQCFWSLTSGRDWHSFAKEPRWPVPAATGECISALGAAPRNFNDREAYWDFIEYASDGRDTWHGNTTQVDAFCIPITIEMGEKKVGITESRRKLFETFGRRQPFQTCLKGDYWIVAPCSAGFGKKGPQANYFDAYQSEMPYDVPNQSSWMSGKTNGFASYKVADTVTSHRGLGPGRLFVLP